MQKGNKLRVVLDTNLLLSSIIIPESTPDKIIQAWTNDLFILIVSRELIQELEDVTSRKKFLKHYRLFKQRSKELIASLESAAELLESLPKKDLQIHSRDPKDDFLLACALEGGADYLITGDRDLLVLNGNPSLGKLKIISAKDFLDSMLIR